MLGFCNNTCVRTETGAASLAYNQRECAIRTARLWFVGTGRRTKTPLWITIDL
jgi:hypothetical protein